MYVYTYPPPKGGTPRSCNTSNATPYFFPRISNISAASCSIEHEHLQTLVKEIMIISQLCYLFAASPSTSPQIPGM